MLAWTQILCAVDFSDASRQALEVAADVARRYGAHLVLLHVTGDPHGTGDVLLAPPEAHDGDRRELARRLEHWRAETEATAGAPIRTLLLDGSPADEIVRVAREGGHDLVVVGTHGRTGLKRALLGSIAERVAHGAPCPVLVVRPRAPMHESPA